MDMNVVINALVYKPNSSGIGVMLRDMLGLYTKITDIPCRVIVPLDAPDFPAGEQAEIIRAPWKYEQGMGRMFFQTFQMGKYCRDAILMTTDSKTPFFLPKSCTLIPIITDLAVFRMPEVYNRSRVLLWRFQYRYVCQRADLFIAVSAFTKSEMVKILGIPPEKIHVIPMGCSRKMMRVSDKNILIDLRSRYNLPEKYILFVGNNNPRKNLGRIIQAFDLMKECTDLPHKLVIAGEQGWRFDRTQALESVGHCDDVIFTGFVPDEDLPALYSAADLFAFPTLYEGFGIPVIEAQSCGTPVVTSNLSALPEVAGNGAELVDPYDVENICEAMRKVLKDKAFAAELVKKGHENAKRFSWDASAGLLKEIVEGKVV